MRDLINNTSMSWVAGGTLTSTGSPSELLSGSIDLQGYEGAEVFALIGSIDEMGTSPVGGAQADLKLYESDDNTTFTEVALASTVGPTSVTSGVVASTTSNFTAIRADYRGNKRYLKVALVATSLANGGPAMVGCIKFRPRHVGTVV